jgi:hypothetical protein
VASGSDQLVNLNVERETLFVHKHGDSDVIALLAQSLSIGYTSRC